MIIFKLLNPIILFLLMFPIFFSEANSNEGLDVVISWNEKKNSFRGTIVEINKGSENNRLRLDRGRNKTVLVYIKKTNILRAWGTGLKGSVLVINGIETPTFKKPGKRKWYQASLTKDEFNSLLSPQDDSISEIKEPTPTTQSTPEVEESAPTAESTPEIIEEPAPTAESTPEITEEPAPTAESIPEVAEESTPTAESTPEITEEPAPTAESTPEITEEPAPTAESTPEITEEPAPTAESIPEITEEPAPTAESIPEITEEPAPTAESTPEITEESAPTAESTPEVAEEPTPTAESTPEITEEPAPTAESIPEVAEESAPTAESIPEVAEESAPTVRSTPEVEEESAPTTRSTPDDRLSKIQALLDGLNDIEKQIMPEDKQESILYYSFEQAKSEIDWWKEVAAFEAKERENIKAYIERLDKDILNHLKNDTIYGGKDFLDNLDDYSLYLHIGMLEDIIDLIKEDIIIQEENERLMVKQKEVNDYLDSIDSKILNMIYPEWVKDWRNPEYDNHIENIRIYIDELINAPRPPKPVMVAYAFHDLNQDFLPILGFKIQGMDKYQTTDPLGNSLKYEIQMRIIGTNQWFDALEVPRGFTGLQWQFDVWEFYYGAVRPFEIRFRIVEWDLAGYGDLSKVNSEWSDIIQIKKAYSMDDVQELIVDENDPNDYNNSLVSSIAEEDWNFVISRLYSIATNINAGEQWIKLDEAGYKRETGITGDVVRKLPEQFGESPRKFIDRIYKEWPEIIFALEKFFNLSISLADKERFEILFKEN